jgi:AraC family transcriptional regulator of adaptative response / DNA-3-methyladenine glycosylase II
MLDAEGCYRVITARDARYDGRFFTGVVTTGVYCRPICPARTPRRETVRFFECAAAAEEAGFRPCRRCRPETTLGSPAWLGTSATVSRALGRILEGDLDEAGTEELASRLGIGSRHLRRLFDAHLGASPRAVAKTRRVHFARQLIDETRLPMTAIASSAGFSSIRRFNAAVLKTFGSAPRDLRREAAHGDGSAAMIELRLPFRPPLDWASLLLFLSRRAIPGVEEVEYGTYRRTVEVEDFEGVIEIRRPAEENHLVLRVPAAASRGLLVIVRRARRLFDLDADPREISRRLSRDSTLGATLRRHAGIRVPGAWDGFEIAIRAILGQQVSVASATTLAGRLALLFGEPLGGAEGRLGRLFPKPQALADARLSRIGLPAARAQTIRRVARAVLDGTLDLDAAADPDGTRSRLEEIRGVGPWTAQYIAMRALGDPDAFLPDDLGIRRALSSKGALPTAAAVRERSEAWRPWRSYAAIALWSKDSRRTGRRRGSNGE